MKDHGEELELFNPWPNFEFTGSLRPAYPLSELRKPAEDISCPNYASRGVPYSENSTVRSSIIEVINPQDIAKIATAAKLVSEILANIGTIATPGTTTDSIDAFVSSKCNETRVYPSLLNYRGFPKSVSTCVNEVAGFGIPDHRKLLDGDILNIRLGVYHKGFHACASRCFHIGPTPTSENLELSTAVDAAMRSAISACAPGKFYRDIGAAIDTTLHDTDFVAVHDHYGHGINFIWRAPPTVPSHYLNTSGIILPGHVFTIRIVLTRSNPNYRVWPNGIVSVTELGTPTAQLEHTISVPEFGNVLVHTQPPALYRERSDDGTPPPRVTNSHPPSPI